MIYGIKNETYLIFLAFLDSSFSRGEFLSLSLLEIKNMRPLL